MRWVAPSWGLRRISATDLGSASPARRVLAPACVTSCPAHRCAARRAALAGERPTWWRRWQASAGSATCAPPGAPGRSFAQRRDLPDRRVQGPSRQRRRRRTLIGAGVTVRQCLRAAGELAADGDRRAGHRSPLGEAARRGRAAGRSDVSSGRLVVAEDRYPQGGLGAAVLKTLAGLGLPLRVRQCAGGGVPGSGTSAELMDAAGISAPHTSAAARALLASCRGLRADATAWTGRASQRQPFGMMIHNGSRVVAPACGSGPRGDPARGRPSVGSRASLLLPLTRGDTGPDYAPRGLAHAGPDQLFAVPEELRQDRCLADADIPGRGQQRHRPLAVRARKRPRAACGPGWASSAV